MTHKLLIPLLFAFLTIQTSCKKSGNTEFPIIPTTYTKVTVAYKAISGIDPNLLSLDIYHFGQITPKSPVIIYVH